MSEQKERVTDNAAKNEKATEKEDTAKATPIVSWCAKETRDHKVIPLQKHSRGIGFQMDTSVVEWTLPTVHSEIPAKITVVSSGFGNTAKVSLGNTNVCLAA